MVSFFGGIGTVRICPWLDLPFVRELRTKLEGELRRQNEQPVGKRETGG